MDHLLSRSLQGSRKRLCNHSRSPLLREFSHARRVGALRSASALIFGLSIKLGLSQSMFPRSAHLAHYADFLLRLLERVARLGWRGRWARACSREQKFLHVQSGKR